MEIIEQLTEWVRGNPAHNTDRDECCPDFSCCNPKLLADEHTRQRFLQAYQENDSDTMNKMLFGFLGAMIEARGLSGQVHVVGDETNIQNLQ